MTQSRLLLAAAISLTVAMVAQATTFDLYTTVAAPGQYKVFGAANTPGKERAQVFNATTSTPNALATTDEFDSVSFEACVLQTYTSISFSLALYNWNTNYATTIAGTPIGTSGLYTMTSGAKGGGTIVDLSEANRVVQTATVSLAEPVTANATYMLRLLVSSNDPDHNYGGNWGLLYSGSNSGGTNNDAYNDAAKKTDREYQIRLNVVPEPGTALALLGGLLLVVRRRR